MGRPAARRRWCVAVQVEALRRKCLGVVGVVTLAVVTLETLYKLPLPGVVHFILSKDILLSSNNIFLFSPIRRLIDFYYFFTLKILRLTWEVFLYFFFNVEAFSSVIFYLISKEGVGST